VQHQIEIDALSDQRVARPEEILDRVQRLDDLRFDTCFFEDFSQRRRLGSLARSDRPFRQSPASAAARGDHGDRRHAIPDRDHRAA